MFCISRRGPSLIFFILFWFAFAAKANQPVCGEPPAEWREYLELDQKYNVPGRPLLTPKDLKTQFVYEYDVPVVDGNNYFRLAEGRPPTTASLYVAESWNGPPKRLLSKALGKPKRVFCGKRVQGHTTVFVWDPEQKEKPFFAKVGDTSQNNNRLFAKALEQSKIKGLGFLPETETVIFEHKQRPFWFGKERTLFELSSIRREAIPIGAGLNDSTRLLPLHGFLSSPKIDEVAAKMGMTRDEWIRQQYIPKLAEFTANMHLRLGFHHQSHTQNLLIEIADNGEIKTFVVRDFYGIMPDNLKLLMDGRISMIGGVENDIYLNGNFFDAGYRVIDKYNLSKPGVNFGSYAMDAVVVMGKDPVGKMELAELFLKNYVQNAESVVARPLTLSEKSQKVFSWFKNRNPSFYGGIDSEYVKKQSLLGAAFSEVIGDVYNQVARETAKKMPVYESTEAQSRLKTIYDELVKNGYYFVYSDSDEADRTHLGKIDGRKYAYDGEKFLVLNSENRVIAATFGVSPEFKKRLDDLGYIADPKVFCIRKFQVFAGRR